MIIDKRTSSTLIVLHYPLMPASLQKRTDWHSSSTNPQPSFIGPDDEGISSRFHCVDPDPA
jgi:hypothetical protein